MKKILLPLIFIAISQSAGLIGSIFTAKSIPTWYAGLEKPSFNPPNWIFGPVWTLLFVFMGIASYLVFLQWRKNKLAKTATVFFFVHLIFNTAWSIIFFGLQSPGPALVEIAFLWIMILSLIFLFYKIDKRAAYLMIPYLAWVSFASVLNFYIWILN